MNEMRQYKFRAWTGKQMMYQDKQYLGSFLRRVVMQIMLEHGSDAPREHESYLPKGTTIDDYLLQFTGLKDRNGKDIYEGDIVATGLTDQYVKSIVRIGEWETSIERDERSITKPYYGVYLEGSLDLEAYLLRGEMYIIGNIYESESIP